MYFRGVYFEISVVTRLALEFKRKAPLLWKISADRLGTSEMKEKEKEKKGCRSTFNFESRACPARAGARFSRDSSHCLGVLGGLPALCTSCLHNSIRLSIIPPIMDITNPYWKARSRDAEAAGCVSSFCGYRKSKRIKFLTLLLTSLLCGIRGNLSFHLLFLKSIRKVGLFVLIAHFVADIIDFIIDCCFWN